MQTSDEAVSMVQRPFACLMLVVLLSPVGAVSVLAQEAETGFQEPFERPENPAKHVLAEPVIPPGPGPRPSAAPSSHELLDPGDLVLLPEPGIPEWPSVWDRWPVAARTNGGVVANRQVIAYYGHPNSEYMGVLGESSMDAVAAELHLRAAEYDELNGEIGVAPAFHLIYGTVYEDATIGLLRRSTVLEYIEFAAENGLLVFLDHQIGRFTLTEAIHTMLTYLEYDNVHLAIDPEWATSLPGEEIGQVHADYINAAQEQIEQYLIDHGIAGPKMLVVHQFNWKMIADRHLVRTDFAHVDLIHNADGFGPPEDKQLSWDFNAGATNMPLKGFKLFYPKPWKSGGYDDPLMQPSQVLQLDPVPVYIQYQ